MAYTRKQLITLVACCVAQFCNAACISLQAPFYPAEAEKKGATATQYGLVFGVFELTSFLVSPIYGRFLSTLGAKFINNTGIFTGSIMCILFGFLDRIDDTTTFIGLSFAVRIVEALGFAAFITSVYGIIPQVFPNDLGAIFATLETFFGLGLIAGPTVGGALFELGGYTLPFLAMGIILMLAAILTYCLLPSSGTQSSRSEGPQGYFLAALRLPSISLALFSTAAASISIGFLDATLEPHLRPLNLTPFQTGLMFVLNGATYALSAPCWGWLCDHWLSPRSVTAFGAVTVVVAFMFVGPMPFLPIPTSLPACITALVVHGIGLGAQLVSTFTGIHRDVIVNGFPNDLGTYGLVSGIWTSAFSLGCFVGPSVGGYLVNLIGFGWATFIVATLHAMVVICNVIVMCIFWKRREISLFASANNSLSQSKEETEAITSTSNINPHSVSKDRDSTCCSASSSQDYIPF